MADPVEFVGRKDPQEEKWFGLTWGQELAGNPPVIQASTVQSAAWEVEGGSDISILAHRETDASTAVRVGAGSPGDHVLKVIMVSDQGEIHVRRAKITIETH